MMRKDESGIFLMAAMEMEVKPLLSRFRKVSPKNPLLYECQIDNRKVSLVVSGVGKERAEETARWVTRQKPELVIGLGYAGGLSPTLLSGELFLPREVRNYEGQRYNLRGLSGDVPEGTLLTVDRIVQSREEKTKLRPLADAVDMESFSIAEVMNEKGIPFAIIRVISDAAGDTLPLDFSGLLKESRDGLPQMTWGAIKLLLHNPLKIPSLIRLGIQSKYMSNKLSEFSLSVLSHARIS